MPLQEVQVSQILLRVLLKPALLRQGLRVRKLLQFGCQLQAPAEFERRDQWQAQFLGEGLQVHQIGLPEEVLRLFQ